MELTKNVQKQKDYYMRAKELVRQMTLEEKVAQTLYNSPEIKRLGIKAYNWWNEALHGVARAGTATVFPQAIGMAATFDEDLLEKVGDAVSTEGRAKFNMQQEGKDSDIYKGLTFWAPNVNIFRDPRWGRGHETFGEDPYLTGRLGVRYIEGLQGHDENYLKAAACAKHYAVHSGPEGIRHEFDAKVGKRDLYETYLPAFKACVEEAGVEAVMGAYNRVNGEPCCGSHILLMDILRDKWHFEGHVVSDCGAIRDFYENHCVVDTAVEAAALAMNNGCDLNCGSVFLYLTDAVKKGLVKEERLDEAVTALLIARMKLGALDKKEENPYDMIPYSVVDSLEMQNFNESVAEKTIVLLKNSNYTLPLNKKNLHKVGVIGPNANSRKALVGNYEGTASRYITVLEGIQDYLGNDVRVLYSEGCPLYMDRTSGLAERMDREAEARAVCRESDVIILVMGLDATLEGEQGDAGNEYGSGDKPDLKLPGVQHEVVKIAKEYGKPVVLVVLSGSAISLEWEEKNVDAILQGWYPGARGGKAIANIIFGERNPQGKLPVTFYRSADELPAFEDYSMEGRTYRFMKQDALFPFGYGLSYNKYHYADTKLVESQFDVKDGISLQTTVKNCGQYVGTETIQIYISRRGEKRMNPQLKKIEKVCLNPNEEKKVAIHLQAESFYTFDANGDERLVPGIYDIYVGGSQPDKRSEDLMGVRVEHLEVVVGE